MNRARLDEFTDRADSAELLRREQLSRLVAIRHQLQLDQALEPHPDHPGCFRYGPPLTAEERDDLINEARTLARKLRV